MILQSKGLWGLAQELVSQRLNLCQNLQSAGDTALLGSLLQMLASRYPGVVVSKSHKQWLATTGLDSLAVLEATT